MFGIDPDAINGLAELRQQIEAFMSATNVALAQIQKQLTRIENAQNEERKNG